MTDPDSTPSSRAWLVLVLLWGVAFSYYLTRNMLTTMHGSIVAAIRMTDRQFGLLTSVFLWVYAQMNPLGGALADRFSRSRVIIASMLAWSAVTWLTGHATTFPQLLALRAVMGISQGCYMPAASALITDYHRASTRSLSEGRVKRERSKPRGMTSNFSGGATSISTSVSRTSSLTAIRRCVRRARKRSTPSRGRS